MRGRVLVVVGNWGGGGGVRGGRGGGRDVWWM